LEQAIENNEFVDRHEDTLRQDHPDTSKDPSILSTDALKKLI
jgi:hypothetical protein